MAECEELVFDLEDFDLGEMNFSFEEIENDEWEYDSDSWSMSTNSLQAVLEHQNYKGNIYLLWGNKYFMCVNSKTPKFSIKITREIATLGIKKL